MALRFDVVPDVFELTVCADEKGATDDAEERTAEELLHAARPIGFDRFEIGIAEEIEIQLLLGFEAGLDFDGVAAHSQDDHAKLVELPFCVAKLGRFNRSAGRVRLRIEEEHDAFAEMVGERDVVAGVVLQAKRGGFVAYFKHVRILRRAIR
jgi:hypothetical protein